MLPGEREHNILRAEAHLGCNGTVSARRCSGAGETGDANATREGWLGCEHWQTRELLLYKQAHEYFAGNDML